MKGVLSPNDAVLVPLMKYLLKSMKDEELRNHVEEDKASGKPNLRNGKVEKTVISLSL